MSDDDALSEVLRAVRLKGATFFDVEARDPWVAQAPAAARIAPYIMPGVEHVIEYHVVTEGSCFGGLLDGAPTVLSAGDILVFPQGDAHVLSSAPGMRTEPDMALHQGLGPRSLPVTICTGTGPRASARLVCGFLGCDLRPFNPLIGHLPRMLHVRATGGSDGATAQFIALALSEAGALTAGSQCMLSRLSELMFIDAVRRYLTELPGDAHGFLAGLRDPYVGRALGKLHGSPSRAWTVEELAREVGTSRSMLAERFTELVGTPPIQYLAQWRIHLVAAALATGGQSLSEIAAEVGYGSEAALSRAFKRQLGIAPAMWRKGRRPLDAEASRPD